MSRNSTIKAKKADHPLTGIDANFRHWITLLVWVCTSVSFFAYGQEYGLEFAAKPISKDHRTALELNPEGYYSFRGDFELSFSLQLRDMAPVTFGYIARIVDVEGQNIDIIFNGPESHSLQVVYGQSLTNITIPNNEPDIYEQWTEIKLRYEINEKTLYFETPDTSILHRDVDLSGKIKIFFGKNDFNPIQTTDVPRMNIKDIRIFQRGKCLHHFPLDEMSGNEANDVVTNRKAIVQNPGWIKPRYYFWDHAFDTYLGGLAVSCFEPGEEKLYMVGEDMMKIFFVLKDSIRDVAYSARFTDLIRGSQVFYDTVTNRLICYNLKIKTVHYFNFATLLWEEISNGPNTLERFWFHNKFYSEPDSVLYVFGGYSQHKYYNLVQRYDFKNNQWDTVQTRGEVFHPRMHAAIGDFADTLYILGGFGSMAGDQILNPVHYTDLLAFSLADKAFIKKYEFEAPMEGIDFAHSMVINEDRSFYVLATTIFEYETYLQLLRGNLSDPELVKVADKIPYLFDNEFSNSDLFYSKSSQELIAASSLADFEKNETHISVYKIAYPPYVTEMETEENRSLAGRIVFITLLLLIVIATLIILIQKSKRKVSRSAIPDEARQDEKEDSEVRPSTGTLKDKPGRPPNSILFFGGFQVINKQGVDITKKFTPLLKELFLLIFLHSIKDKGISVPSLTETLWFSMDAKTAKNNRAVNIAKLKNLLSEIESCQLSSRTGYWQLEFNDSIVYNDYASCINSLNREELFSKVEFLQFLSTVKKGPLLGNASYEWLDEFKLDCSNMLIDHLSQYVDQDEFASDPELMVQLADAILIFDIMHEEAISIKCRALTELGKHSIAKEIFTKFSKDYQTLYDEPFGRSFTDIVKETRNPE